MGDRWVMEGNVGLTDEQHYVYEQVSRLADGSGASEYAVLLGWCETGHVTLDDAFRVAAALGDEQHFTDMVEEVFG